MNPNNIPFQLTCSRRGQRRDEAYGVALDGVTKFGRAYPQRLHAGRLISNGGRVRAWTKLKQLSWIASRSGASPAVSVALESRLPLNCPLTTPRFVLKPVVSASGSGREKEEGDHRWERAKNSCQHPRPITNHRGEKLRTIRPRGTRTPPSKKRSHAFRLAE